MKLPNKDLIIFRQPAMRRIIYHIDRIDRVPFTRYLLSASLDMSFGTVSGRMADLERIGMIEKIPGCYFKHERKQLHRIHDEAVKYIKGMSDISNWIKPEEAWVINYSKNPKSPYVVSDAYVKSVRWNEFMQLVTSLERVESL